MGEEAMNQLEQFVNNTENEPFVILKIDVELIENHIEDFLTQLEASKVQILCLSTDKKVDKLLQVCEKIKTSRLLIVEVPFHRVFSYGIKEFTERAKKANISSFRILDLPYEEQGQVVVHLLDTDGPNLLQEVTISSGDRVPTILQYARGFAWCSSKGYSKQLAELPGDPKEYYLFAVDAVSPLPLVLDFGADSSKELGEYLDNAAGYIVGSGLETSIREHGYSSEEVNKYLGLL